MPELFQIERVAAYRSEALPNETKVINCVC
jgi:hypothetical protein